MKIRSILKLAILGLAGYGGYVLWKQYGEPLVAGTAEPAARDDSPPVRRIHERPDEIVDDLARPSIRSLTPEHERLTMKLTHRFSRSLIAPMFVAGGVDAFVHPETKAGKADVIAAPLFSTLGLRDDPVALVRLNAGVQVVAGALLCIGVFPRVAALALAGSLIPTTIAGHRFWDEADQQARATQRTQFLKNTAMLGGLFLVATDAT